MSGLSAKSEQPLLIDCANERKLYGVLHRQNGMSRRHGIVFCHPLAEEKLWAHRVQVHLARRLAAAGYSVLRFDFFGEGDSSGDFEESTMATRLKNLETAVEFLSEPEHKLAEVSLFGLRLGASVVALAAEQLQGISRLVLWEPVIDGDKYVQELLRSQLTTQLAAWGQVRKDRAALAEDLQQGEFVNIDGYLLSPKFYSELVAMNLTGKRAFDGPCLIVQLSKRQKRVRSELSEFAASFQSASCRFAAEEPFWRETRSFCPRGEEVTDMTVNWLVEGGND